ncbi:hypothetical protein I552_5385 [Mycobacterium xenopi 3993]|nr:hypothetical protein I552_5385 [Mycobacterium xenopi 3993]
MVVVEGQNGDGVTVEEDSFDTAAGLGLATLGASEQVVAAILGTREGAAEAGHHLLATGVTWTDQAEAASLRDALAAHQVENVMLVSAFLAAAALAQTVGSAIGYEHIAMLFVEPDTATLAVVDSADGSITDVRRQSLTPGDDPGPGLLSLVAGLEALQSRPEGLFVVGSGVDVAAIKPRLEAATPLAVSAPEEPETALAAARRWRRPTRRCLRRRPPLWPTRRIPAPVRSIRWLTWVSCRVPRILRRVMGFWLTAPPVKPTRQPSPPTPGSGVGRCCWSVAR